MKTVCLVGVVAVALLGLAGCSKDPAPAAASGPGGAPATVPENSGPNPVAAKGGGMSRIPAKK
jgi:hypothetical protein